MAHFRLISENVNLHQGMTKKQHLPNDIQPDDMDLCHRRVCMYRIGLHLKLTLKIQNEYNFLSTPIHKLVKDTLCNDDLAEAASHH